MKPIKTIVEKNSKSFNSFGRYLTYIEYIAQANEDAKIQKSPALNFKLRILFISPFNIKNSTPNVEITIPKSCFLFVSCFKITYDKKSIIIGILEFIIKAFVAVVVVSPIYKRVLNPVIPNMANINKILKLFLILLYIFALLKNKIGDIRIRTNNHLKNINSKGSISSFINLPSTKLPDQNNTHSVNKK